MKTTVVVPNYNGIQYLKACMDKLLLAKQQGEFQIILVDNGSSDGSERLCLEYAGSGTAKLISFTKNTGFCGAANAGIDACNTEYVLLLNNDTEVTENFVAELEHFMDTHKNAFSASAKMLSLRHPDIIDDCGDLYCALGWAFALGKGKQKQFYEKDGEIFAACGGAAIYRMEMLNRIGKFDENHFAYLEDIDLGYRAKINGFHNYFCHTAVVYHAGSGFSGSRYNPFKIDLSAKNSIYLIYKNMPFLQILINFLFLLIGFTVKFLFFAKKGYGKHYLKGLIRGFRLCISEKGREKKVVFKGRNLGNYIKIQLLLWWNIIRRFLG